MKSRNQILAVKLAIAFSEEGEIPAKYKKRKRRTPKQEDKTNIETAFEVKVDNWMATVTNIFEKFSVDDGFRFVTITPRINDEDKEVSLCEDFQALNSYLEQRRDIENCSDEELGCLAMLLTAFQKEAERILKGEEVEESEIHLKNIDAQKLMEKKRITMNGIDLNLWQGHSFDSVSGQKTWNSIRSYAELNGKSSGENGSIVITGIFQIPRQEAGELAAMLGFKVHSSLSRNTDFLIVGSGNVGPTKIADMISINKKGGKIKLISEIEFLEMLAENIDSSAIKKTNRNVDSVS